jgi:hypothetical protein
VDFISVESLTAALKGIDAVVSTVPGVAIKDQIPLIDAAAAAGVKRFIPSEFGAVTFNPKLETFPLYENIFKIKRHLQAKADAGQMTWSVLAPGAWVEFMFMPGILDFATRTATLVDQGDNRLSVNTLATSGKAIAAILSNPEATKNRVVKISEMILTQNQVLKIAQRLRPEDQWEVTKVAATDCLQEALEAIRAGDIRPMVRSKLAKGTGYAGETYGSAYDENDNELLGIKKWTEKDLEKIVAVQLA